NLKITSKMQYYCAYLLDANSNKLWSSENNQYDAAKKQRTDSYDFELSAGTYYLKINGLKASNFPYYLTRSKGNYSFALTFATAGQTSVEPNDSLVNPNKISLGNKVVGHLSLTDKADYYEVTVAAGGAMIAFNSYLNSYNIRVLDADNKEVWSSRDNALAEKATSRKDLHELNLSAGTYFVVVDGGMGKYNFVFSKKVSVGKVKKVSYDRSTTAITLEWSKVSGAAGYEIFRYDEKKKDYVKIGSTTTKRYLTLKNLKSGTTYKFKVRAYKKLNDSVIYGAFSSEKATTTVPAKTTIKSAKAIGKNKATVTWSAVNGATGYVVYYTTDKDFDYVDSTRVKDGKATSKTLKKLKKGKKYYFKVKAYKSFNGKRVYGAISKTKSAKIK
ncbi:MAG: fibronectin type III domain-containing protein, partial [Clostridia bacterium]|nr:fibronectin type III domain-containing protein [Clostridia bacterium]